MCGAIAGEKLYSMPGGKYFAEQQKNSAESFGFQGKTAFLNVDHSHMIHVWYITYIDYKNQPNVGKCNIYGSYGIFGCILLGLFQQKTCLLENVMKSGSEKPSIFLEKIVRLQDQGRKDAHRIHGTGIFTCIYHKN